MFLISHHLIADAVGLMLIRDELIATLAEMPLFAASPSSAATTTSAPYAEFVKNQKQRLSNGEFEEAMEFCCAQLLDDEKQLLQTVLKPRLHTKGADTAFVQKGATVCVNLSSALANAIAKVRRSRRVPLYLAAWSILLSQHSGSIDVVTGVAVSGRSERRWAQTVGHFVNILPVKFSVSQATPAADYLQEVESKLRAVLAYQDCPLMAVVADPRIRAARIGPGVLSSMFNHFEAQRAGGVGGDNVNCPPALWEPIEVSQQENQFDLSLWAVAAPEGLAFSLKFNADVLQADTVQSMAAHYGNLLFALTTAILDGASPPLREIQMLSTEETDQLLSGDGPSSVLAYGPTRQLTVGAGSETLLQLFICRLERQPHAVAIRFGHGSNWSYIELAEWALRVSFLLKNAGAKPGDAVAVIVPNTRPELIGSALALWHCGCIYVPLSMQHPLQRNRTIMDIADCAILLVTEETSTPGFSGLSRPGVTTIPLESLATNTNDKSQSGTRDAYSLADARPAAAPAYMMFTSGSTGTPKAVVVPQAGVTARIMWLVRQYDITVSDRYLQSTAPVFDISIAEMFTPLAAGASVVLMPPSSTVADAIDTVRVNGVTLVSMCASLWFALLDDLVSCPTLRHLFSVGEAMSPEMAARWIARRAPHMQLHNLYGPTEFSIYATHYTVDVPPATGEIHMPIGRPCEGVECYIFGPAGCLAPPGVPGELVLAGEGIADGYHKQEEGNTGPFVWQAFAGIKQRCYHTGDIVAWGTDGSIVYLGRRDSRKKINGQLVELGEIESTLLRHPGVASAAVTLASTEINSSQRTVIAAFAVPRLTTGGCGAGDVTSSSLISHLRRTLPDFMIPTQVCLLEELPATVNGKVDKVTLARMWMQKLQQEQVPSAVEGADATEESLGEVGEILLDLWKRMLGMQVIHLHQHLFQSGGDSLTAIRISLALKANGYELSLPVPATFGAQLQKLRGQTRQQLIPATNSVSKRTMTNTPSSSLVQLTAGTQPTPATLVLVHGADGSASVFAPLADLLSQGSSLDVYAFQYS